MHAAENVGESARVQFPKYSPQKALGPICTKEMMVQI